MTLPCPSCGAPLAGGPTCPACGVRLVGPDAQRLWVVDQELLGLDARRSALLAERSHLLAVLRAPAGTAVLSPPSPTPAPGLSPAAGPAAGQPGPDWPALPPGPRVGPAEWSPQRVQNTLLGLGAVLLAIAATVFAAVTYDRLGAGGRAAVLLGLTVAALAAVPALLRRGLAASAETATGVALALAALDAYGLRELGLGEDWRASSYAAAASAVLAAAAAGWGAAFPALRTPAVAAVLLAQLPVPLLLARAEAGPGEVGLVLAGQCAADLAVVLGLRGRLPRPAGVAAAGSAAALAAVGLTASLGSASESEGAGAAGLVVWAALAGGLGVAVRDAVLRVLLTALPVPLLGLAAYSVVRDDLTPVQEPLVAAAVGLLAAQAAVLLPRAWRPGPLGGAVVVAAVGVGAQLLPVLEALAGPLGWAVDPWSLPSGSSAREAVSPDAVWSGSVVTLVVLVAAAATAVTVAAGLHRLEEALAPASVLLLASAVLLPLGLATSYAVALGVLLAEGAALVALGLAAGRSRPGLGTGLVVTGTATVLVAVAWSLASEGASLAVLPASAALLAVTSGLEGRRVTADASALLAGLLGAGALAATGASAGLAADQVGGLLLAGVGALLGGSLLARRSPLECAAAVTAAAALVLALPDPGWLSWVLAGSGLMALALALRPDRRALALAGALLLAASSWVRLADAGVVSPEPYVVPLGLVALLLGHLRRRAAPATTGSLAAYAPGLGLLLGPSLLYALGDDGLLRPVLLLAAAAAVAVTGVAGRLRGPLLVGGGVVLVDALHLLAPYAAALPRWLPLAAVGLGLVVLGATYEQRRQDLAALRARLDGWA